MIIDMSGGTVGISASIRQGHPIRGTGGWFSPSPYLMLIYEMFLL
jgi:hypothetical protein